MERDAGEPWAAYRLVPVFFFATGAERFDTVATGERGFKSGFLGKDADRLSRSTRDLDNIETFEEFPPGGHQLSPIARGKTFTKHSGHSECL